MADSSSDLTALIARAEHLRDEMRDCERALVHDAADWRETADKISGVTAANLTRDAVENETKATQVERWADEVDAIRDALTAAEARCRAVEQELHDQRWQHAQELKRAEAAEQALAALRGTGPR